MFICVYVCIVYALRMCVHIPNKGIELKVRFGAVVLQNREICDIFLHCFDPFLLHSTQLQPLTKQPTKMMQQVAKTGPSVASALLLNGLQQQRGMATLKMIQMRLKSVKNIQKITQSMKMVSAAK